MIARRQAGGLGKEGRGGWTPDACRGGGGAVHWRASRLVVGLWRCYRRRLKQRQHGVFADFPAGSTHGRHVEIDACEKGLKVATLDDEAVDAKGQRQGNEEHES